MIVFTSGNGEAVVGILRTVVILVEVDPLTVVHLPLMQVVLAWLLWNWAFAGATDTNVSSRIDSRAKIDVLAITEAPLVIFRFFLMSRNRHGSIVNHKGCKWLKQKSTLLSG